jgi:hypothetical protein
MKKISDTRIKLWVAQTVLVGTVVIFFVMVALGITELANLALIFGFDFIKPELSKIAQYSGLLCYLATIIFAWFYRHKHEEAKREISIFWMVFFTAATFIPLAGLLEIDYLTVYFSYLMNLAVFVMFSHIAFVTIKLVREAIGDIKEYV